ncbi:MAG: site-2 protease family protein [Gammaproteobacteria bacterium]
MLESSIRIGSVAGIRIGIHYTWFIIFALLSFSLYAVLGSQHPDWGSRTALLTAVLTALVFFASIVLHELGHSIVAISRGIRVQSITLFIFGGMAQTEGDADTAATEFWVAIAGPLVSLALAAAFYLLNQVFTVGPLGEALAWLATINLLVALFNLVPGFPLDGGRVFRAAVWGITGNAQKGMQWAVMSGRIVAYGLMGYGVLIALQTGYLLNGIWFVAIGWFLLSAAEASGRQYSVEHLFAAVRVRDIVQHDVPRVEAGRSLLEWIDHEVLVTGERAALVGEGSDVVGLVTLSDCGKVPREAWDRTRVAEVMTPARQLHTVDMDASIRDVLDLMQRHALNQVPVLERGRLTGWIDRERLLHIMQRHTEIGR